MPSFTTVRLPTSKKLMQINVIRQLQIQFTLFTLEDDMAWMNNEYLS